MSPFESLMQEALQASAQNDWQHAVALFDEAARADPASPLPHFMRAAEHAQAGHIDLAEADFANTLLLAPGFELARYQLGLLQFSSARAALALVTWQPLFALPDGHAFKHFVLGFEHLAHDRFEAATASFERGLECTDVNPAVAGDVRKVLDGIQAVQREAPPSAEPAESDEAAGATSHVLVSNYGRG